MSAWSRERCVVVTAPFLDEEERGQGEDQEGESQDQKRGGVRPAEHIEGHHAYADTDERADVADSHPEPGDAAPVGRGADIDEEGVVDDRADIERDEGQSEEGE